MTFSSDQLDATLDAIDAANQQDPNLVLTEGQSQSKELLYGKRMSAALSTFSPEASEALQIACRAQHIQRWQIPRSDYPANRPGYLQWRKELGKFHAQRTAEIMASQGYDETNIEKVKTILQKQGIKQNAEVQTFEDVICLVFVQFYLADFAQGKDADKLANIIRKTWAKMSEQGQSALLKINLHPDLLSTLNNALSA